MITIEFVRDVYLPRFNMKIGDLWEKRKDNITEKGFNLGGGFVPSKSYKIKCEENEL